MKTALTVAGYTLGLIAVFGAAAGLGALVSPSVTGAATTGPSATAHGEMSDSTAPVPAGAAAWPGGLMVAQDGYTLSLADRSLPADAHAQLRFQILGPDGAPVTGYETEHDKQLHLILVRRDLDQFQHVHPVLDPAGTWSVPVDLSAAGEYRVFADFTPTGHDGGLVLGADLAVPGSYEPRPVPAPAATASVAGGYQVTLSGDLVPDRSSELTLTVSRDGVPVTDLQPYLAAYGHLVALRAGDLAYLHVHPAGAPGDGVTPAGPGITFAATAPSAGEYRLFLDFKHAGVVRTAEFTVTARPDAATTSIATPLATPVATPVATESGDHGH